MRLWWASQCKDTFVFNSKGDSEYSSHGHESPRAYITRKEEVAGNISEKDIQEWIKSRVAKHKWLTGGVVFIPEVPKLASGKIQRKIMREWAKRDALEIESRSGLKSKL